jgi:HSP20 family protein
MAERRNLFEGVTDFFTELGRIREVGTHGYGHGTEDRERTHATAWVPATDIFARGDDMVIRVEVAGVAPDDVAITFTGGVLTVSGVRTTELGGADEDSFYIRERPYGAYRRAVTLRAGTTDDQISAEIRDGLVEITVKDGCAGGEPQRIALKDASSEPAVRRVGPG